MRYPTKLPGLLTVLALCLVWKLFTGCATRTVTAPSTAGIRQDVQDAKDTNIKIGTVRDRIERKNVLIKRWLEYHGR
jgi:hypothetical protein